MKNKKLFSAFIKSIGNQRGEGYIDYLIKILMTVVIGSLLLTLMQMAVPNLFSDVIGKIQNLLSV